MKNNLFVILILFVIISSCSQKEEKHITDPRAKEMTKNIIPLSRYYQNPDSAKKALTFLDSATVIDKDCYLCYADKLMFLTALKEYEKAIIAVNNMIRLRPNKFDLYETGGLYYELQSDTISAKTYFEKSLTICDQALNSKDLKDADYTMVSMYKSVDLIMLGRTGEANKILKQQIEKEKDEELKNMLQSYVNKTKKELLEILLTDPNIK